MRERDEMDGPLETLFHKIVMIRNNLRVLEQKVNASDKLSCKRRGQNQVLTLLVDAVMEALRFQEVACARLASLRDRRWIA